MAQKRLLAGLAMNKVQKQSDSKSIRSNRSKKDPFAKLNFYKKVSKYDLDRGFVDVMAYNRGKKAVYAENAANKRDIINGEIAEERV